MVGLDEEIALLRARLRTIIRVAPDNYPLIFQALRTLTRLLQAQYRLSGQSEDDLYGAVMGVVKGLGGVLWPDGEP